MAVTSIYPLSSPGVIYKMFVVIYGWHETKRTYGSNRYIAVEFAGCNLQIVRSHIRVARDKLTYGSNKYIPVESAGIPIQYARSHILEAI